MGDADEDLLQLLKRIKNAFIDAVVDQSTADVISYIYYVSLILYYCILIH